MQIRRGTRADLPAIVAIENQCFPDPWPQDLIESYFDDGRAVILVAEHSEPIAFLIARNESARFGGRALHIHDLAVAPAYRRQTVGSSLLSELMGVAGTQKVARIRLEVRVENEAARQFYQHHGFSVVRRVARYYEDGGAALRMERHIAADR